MDDTSTATGLTIGGILSMHNRTLLDLIRRDDHRHTINSKKTWKMFRDKLRLKLVGSVCTTTGPTVASHVRIITRGNRSNSPLPNNTSESVPSEPPVNVSLMALLEVDGCAYLDEEEEEGEGGGEVYKCNNKCCVCMVRHKGAAFIPCGHTFCRHCSRELFARRPNCPLCNNFIFQILDIF